jgi:hypothetical protein
VVRFVSMERADPSEAVKRTVIKWHLDTMSLPSWDELLEMEYVRVHGNINMFTDDVIFHCRERGLMHAVAWYERLRQIYALPSRVFGIAVKYYESERGSQDTWLTEGVVEHMVKLDKR